MDSGLPDFRSTDGFWWAYPALGKLGISFEQMAQPSWVDERPETAWAFYGHRQRSRGIIRRNVLRDFFIGAHAAVRDLPILTRDAGRYRTCFPTVGLITPKR